MGSDEQPTERFRYATPSAPNPVFPGFSRYQNVLKEIINGLIHINSRKIKIFREFCFIKTPMEEKYVLRNGSHGGDHYLYI
jgi:hypothetical protein